MSKTETKREKALPAMAAGLQTVFREKFGFVDPGELTKKLSGWAKKVYLEGETSLFVEIPHKASELTMLLNFNLVGDYFAVYVVNKTKAPWHVASAYIGRPSEFTNAAVLEGKVQFLTQDKILQIEESGEVKFFDPTLIDLTVAGVRK